MKEKLTFASLIEKTLENLRKGLDEASNKTFEKIFTNRYQIYLNELQKEQNTKNQDFQDNRTILNVFEAEKNFKEKLSPVFKNEFFKIFYCIILKLFMNNLSDIFIINIQKELKENENVQKIIREKAENSLKTITEKLKENLILELDEVMKEKREENNKIENENNDEDNNEDNNKDNDEEIDFNF